MRIFMVIVFLLANTSLASPIIVSDIESLATSDDDSSSDANEEWDASSEISSIGDLPDFRSLKFSSQLAFDNLIAKGGIEPEYVHEFQGSLNVFYDICMEIFLNRSISLIIPLHFKNNLVSKLQSRGHGFHCWKTKLIKDRDTLIDDLESAYEILEENFEEQ